MRKTFVLIHGAWMTPACWRDFRGFLEMRGHDCVVPPWPHMERPVDALRRDPAPGLARLTIEDLVDHFDRIVRALPEPPVIVGHSFGGLIVQMLLDRGLGAAGIAIDAGPPRGVLPSLRAVRSAAPVLFAPLGWRRVLTMSFDSFATTFANTLSAAAAHEAYERHVVPAPGRIYFQAALGVGNGVRFANPSRAPLLLLAGEQDRTSTPDMVRAMLRKHRRSPARTDMLAFAGRSHWLIAEPGWEEVAAATLDWTLSLAARETNPD
jgi:pimeloyl-ACP methyl ester carboxylesterase